MSGKRLACQEVVEDTVLHLWHHPQNESRVEEAAD